MFPMIRSTLGHVYKILSRPGIQLLRLNKEQIDQVLAGLDATGRLTRFIQQPYIPQGSVISRMGKLQFYSGQLQQFSASCFDLNFAWASFWNTRSNRVQILEEEAGVLKQLSNEILEQIPRVPLSLHRRWTLQAGADAFATETQFGIGAWITLPHQSDIWASLVGDTHDLPISWQHENLQRHIISFETMAQCLVLLLFIHSSLRGSDFSIQSKLDNQASEAILAQGFTQITHSGELLRAFQKLRYQSQVELQPYRCSSTDNSRADDLSRGRVSQERSEDRFPLTFHTLFSTLLS